MTELIALWIGDSQSAEFSAAALRLAEQARVVKFADASAAREWFASENAAPDLIVLAQSFPGQLDAEAVKPLRTAAPLARIIAVLGTWCEGESRSGHPVPGTIRVYWHQFESRCLRELQQLRSGRCNSWGLAPTATEDERLLMTESHSPTPTQGLAAIITSDQEMANCVSDACGTRGIATVWFLPGQEIRAAGVTAVLWDAPIPVPEQVAELQRLKQTYIPVLALLDFPRVDDHVAALWAGASAVISKPLLWSELFGYLSTNRADNHQK
jgi:CheY-like chemotaxis protein